jgi:hypothetical protein
VRFGVQFAANGIPQVNFLFVLLKWVSDEELDLSLSGLPANRA